MALEADGQIEVVVGVVRIGGHGLAEERNAVLALASQRDALIAEHLGQRQHAGHGGKGLLGVCVVAGEEQRKAAEEAGLQGILRAVHLGEGRGCLFILLPGVLLAPQRHPRRRKGRAERYRLIQVAQALLLVRTR